MKLEEQIVSDLAYGLKTKLIKTVIADLKQNSKLLDEKQSCLENRWEEYCVSIQDKRARHLKDRYKKLAITLLGNHFNELFTYEKIAIWLKTATGVDWLYDKKDQSAELDNVPVHFCDCEDLIYSILESKASEFDNDNVYRYIFLDGEEYHEEADVDEHEQVYE